MGLFDDHTSEAEKHRFNVVEENFDEIFLLGSYQIEDRTDGIQQCLHYKHPYERIKQIYLQALGFFYQDPKGENMSDDLDRFILEYSEGTLEEWEAELIGCTIWGDYVSSSDRSRLILAERYNCSPWEVYYEYIKRLKLEEWTKEEVLGLIRYYRCKRIEESRAFGMSDYDTPACLKEGWTVMEYLRVYGYDGNVVEPNLLEFEYLD